MPSPTSFKTCNANPPAPPTMTVTRTQLDLQSALIDAMSGLVELLSRLSQQLVDATTTVAHAPQCHAEPWREPLESAPVSRNRRKGSSSLWDELSVVELRALLRSYPIDRSSLPAPIELLRRQELVEALNQIQALG